MAAVVWTDEFGVSNYIEFDATPTERHVFSGRASRSPRVTGVPGSDHFEPDADTVTLTGIITNTPITKFTEGDREGVTVSTSLTIPITTTQPVFTPAQISQTGGASKALGFVTPALANTFFPPTFQVAEGQVRRISETVGVVVLAALTDVDRVKYVLERLKAAQRAGTIFTLITKYRTYPQMVCPRIEVPVDTYNSARFSLTFEEWESAEVAFTTITPKVPVRDSRAEKKEDRGQIEGYEETSAEREDKVQSVLKLLNSAEEGLR